VRPLCLSCRSIAWRCVEAHSREHEQPAAPAQQCSADFSRGLSAPPVAQRGAFRGSVAAPERTPPVRAPRRRAIPAWYAVMQHLASITASATFGHLFMQRPTLLLFSSSADCLLMRGSSGARTGSNRDCSVMSPVKQPCEQTGDALIGFRGLMLQHGPRIVTHFEGH